MANPYKVLNVSLDDGDAVIRRRYLEAVRRFPPDRCPEDFRRVRDAYELIGDETSRLKFLLFDASQGETIGDLLTEEKCRTSAKRVGLASLLGVLSEMP